MNFPELTTKFTATFKEVYAAPDGTYERGYNDGHAQGYNDGYAIGEAEGYKDGKTDGYNSGYGEGYTTGEAEGYENGKQTEYDAFWDAYQDYGKQTNGKYIYAGRGWTVDTFKPKYSVTYSSASNMFQEFGNGKKCDLAEILEKQGVVFDFSQCTNLSYAFYGTSFTRIPKIDATGTSTSLSVTDAIFSNSKVLETIDELALKDDGSQRLINTFTACLALKNIHISGTIGLEASFADCSKLSTDSIKSIVNHLSDTATGKTLTLSKTAVNNAVFGDAITANVDSAMSSFIPTITIPVGENERVKVTLETDEGHYIGTDYHWGELKQGDWYIGMSSGGEPCEREFILSQNNWNIENGTGYVYIWFATGGAANFNFKVRAVRIDENGNEIDGINLYSIPDGTYSDYNGTTYTLAKESWESLAASKPNWTITLA